MRILIGMPSAGSQGGPIYCEPLFVRALREAGHEVDEEEYVYGGSADRTPFLRRVSRVIDAARRLRRRTQCFGYDIIHLNTSIDEKCVLRDLTAMAYLRRSRVPVYLKMHGSISGFLKTKNRFWRYLTKRLFAEAAGIGVLSHEERENFINAGCPPEKLSVAKLSIETDIYDTKPDIRARYGVDEGTPIFLFSGRFLKAKGILDVIEACGLIRDEGRNFFLICLGDGPARDDAEKLVRDLELEKHVHFTGYVSEAETAAFHAGSTIFVFPTYHDEGFPLVILKSLAAGLPVVTTHIRAAADYLSEPENCLWVESRSPEELAEKILRLLDDTDLIEAMAQNNRQLAEHFSPERVAEFYLKIYDSILNKT